MARDKNYWNKALRSRNFAEVLTGLLFFAAASLAFLVKVLLWG
jgi:hypothetical protein